MQAAADQFVGTHDFAAVRSVGTDVKTTVRTVYYYNVGASGQPGGFEGCANGFLLQHMARAMAGTVVYAAEGRLPPAIGAILGFRQPHLRRFYRRCRRGDCI